MTQQEALDRILLEARTHSILASEDYIPTLDHYIPLRLFTYYANLIYAAGFDNGCKQHGIRIKVGQYLNGVLIRDFDCGKNAAKVMGVTKASIYKAINTKKKCCGYEWKRLESY